MTAAWWTRDSPAKERLRPGIAAEVEAEALRVNAQAKLQAAGLASSADVPGWVSWHGGRKPLEPCGPGTPNPRRIEPGVCPICSTGDETGDMVEGFHQTCVWGRDELAKLQAALSPMRRPGVVEQGWGLAKKSVWRVWVLVVVVVYMVLDLLAALFRLGFLKMWLAAFAVVLLVGGTSGGFAFVSWWSEMFMDSLGIFSGPPNLDVSQYPTVEDAFTAGVESGRTAP